MPQLSARARLRAGRALAVAIALCALALALLLPAAAGVLRSLPADLGSLLDLALPPWIHNLADVLQIVTAIVALLAWEGTRRARR